MSKQTDPVAALRRGFKIQVGKAVFTIACKRCEKRWQMTKPPAGEKIAAGNILHLLNHEASHQ